MSGLIRLHISWRGEQRDLVIEGSPDDLRHFHIEAQSGADDKLSLRFSGDVTPCAENNIDAPPNKPNGADGVNYAHGDVIGVSRFGQFGHSEFSAEQGMPESLVRLFGKRESVRSSDGAAA